MPNWCDNNITIEGSKESIDHIWNVIHSDDHLNLMALRPLPEGTEDNGTAINLWGTKWSLDIYDIDRYTAVDGTASIHIQALSAWAPPIELLRYITESFTDVKCHITFYEEGMDFVGAATCINGQIFDSESSISNSLPEDFDWNSSDSQDVINNVIDSLKQDHEQAVGDQLRVKGTI